MRIPTSTVLLSSCLLGLFGAGFTHAQEFSGSADYAFPDPGFEQPANYGYQPPGGYAYPGDVPIGAYPDPGLESYASPLQTTYNEEGLWYHEKLFRERQVQVGIEYIVARLRRPGTDVVGNPDPDIPPFDFSPGIAFRHWDVGVFTEDLEGHGIRGRLNIINPDDTGIQTNLWWVAESQDHFTPRRRADSLTDVDGLFARGGVPVDDDGGGYTITYDQGYDLYYTSQAYGGDVDFFSSPFWETNGIKVRGMAGMKFLRVYENFHFRGASSNFDYTVNILDGTIDPLTVVDIGVPPHTTDVYSTTSSYLAGPQVGIQYELGGEKLKFWGQSKLAVTANYERLALSGHHLGDPVIAGPFPTPTILDPNPTDFNVEDNGTHVSPVFQTSINAEIPIFGYLPIFKESSLLENAKFRVGYDFILAGELVRPTKVINWRSPSPDLSITRSRWTMGSVNFAIDWRY